MSGGMIGVKLGCSRYFNSETGESTPVTVILLNDNHVSQVKPEYQALQLAVGSARRFNKPQKGHLKGSDVGSYLKEVRPEQADFENYKLGDKIGIDFFSEDEVVDVTAKTKGKGFAGCVKRHGFKMGDATHGNSKAHRKPGSIGQCQDPGRVFKNKKLPGHMGNVQRTQKNLRIMKIHLEQKVILVKGAVPGFPGQYVMVRRSLKNK